MKEQSTTMPEAYRKPCQQFLNGLYVLWAGSWIEPAWRSEAAVDDWWGRMVQAADDVCRKAHEALPESEHGFVDHTVFCLMESIEQRIARETGGPHARRNQVEKLISKMGYVKKENEQHDDAGNPELAEMPGQTAQQGLLHSGD